MYVLGFALAGICLFGCSKSSDAQPTGSSSSSSSAPTPPAGSGASTGAPSAAGSATSTASASPIVDPSPAKSASAADAGLACGGKTNPCPLQAWMKTNANTAVASGDAATIGKSFEDMVRFAPPGYANWVSISNDGAKAARSGNVEAAKAACRTCHEQYKERYKKELRDRKL
jgi:hypothetical protein